MRNKKGHRSGRDNSSHNEVQQVYDPADELSSLSDLLTKTVGILHHPKMNQAERAAEWTIFQRTLNDYVGAKYGI